MLAQMVSFTILNGSEFANFRLEYHAESREFFTTRQMLSGQTARSKRASGREREEGDCARDNADARERVLVVPAGNIEKWITCKMKSLTCERQRGPPY